MLSTDDFLNNIVYFFVLSCTVLILYKDTKSVKKLFFLRYV